MASFELEDPLPPVFGEVKSEKNETLLYADAVGVQTTKLKAELVAQRSTMQWMDVDNKGLSSDLAVTQR